MLLMQCDWSKITVAKAEQIADFIIVVYEWQPRSNKFINRVHHYLTPKKDPDVALTALRSLVSASKQANERLDRVVVFTDGGPADFHMKKWLHYEFVIARDIGVKLEHIILAPHHGDGACDLAKSQANRKLVNFLLMNGTDRVELDFIERTFSGVTNHQATILRGRQVTGYREPDAMHEIRMCHRFVADDDEQFILGYDQSLVDVKHQRPLRWEY